MKKFGKRSTAEQVSEGVDLDGKNVLITGANTGIGKETARVLALRGATVTMACRNLVKGEAARSEILAQHGAIAPEKLELMELDLDELSRVRDFAARYNALDRPLHLLINNAGIMIDFERRTTDGFEAQFGVNHLAHFLLSNLLLERLREAGKARVVCVSSTAMSWATMKPGLDDLNWDDRKVNGMRAYGDSKAMNMMFAREFNRRHGTEGIVANALHPGVIATELARDQGILLKLIGVVILPFMKNVAQGAATSVFVATAPEYQERGGLYFSDSHETKAPYKLVYDDAACSKLWERSAEIVGLD
jgi:NAD(P)-dependent dehydrogenase (short-subunit alcohol dehydrogenase family)